MTFFLTASCGQNPFAELSSKDSQDALYESIKLSIDGNDYTKAYETSVSLEGRFPGFAATDEYKRTKISVLAGQCGFTFLTFVNGVSAAAGSSLFEKLANTFTGTVTPDKCIAAVAVLKTISTPSTGDSLYSLILNLANIGVIIKDSNSGTIDVCGVGPTISSDEISTIRMKNLVASFGTVLSSTSNIGDAISGGLSSLDSLSAICNPGGGATAAEIALATALAGVCGAADPSTVTAESAAVFRRLLKDNSAGMGGCDIATDIVLSADGLNNDYACCPNLTPNLPGDTFRAFGTETD